MTTLEALVTEFEDKVSCAIEIEIREFVTKFYEQVYEAGKQEAIEEIAQVLGKMNEKKIGDEIGGYIADPTLLYGYTVAVSEVISTLSSLKGKSI